MTTTAAVTFAVETVVPSAIGLVLLHDQVRAGYPVVAAVGFVATLGGCDRAGPTTEPPPEPDAVEPAPGRSSG